MPQSTKDKNGDIRSIKTNLTAVPPKVDKHSLNKVLAY